MSDRVVQRQGSRGVIQDAQRVEALAPYASAALRKLVQVHATTRINDLAIPPGNQLKKLGGADVWQIRIERQHRVRFRWAGKDAHDVEIGDFH